jgi:predicted permease
MLHDLKNASRALIKTPWFTCIVVVTLALGIGANTAIFGVVNTLLLNPLPYANADRLVFVRLGNERVPFGFPLPGFVAGKWRDEARSFEAVEAYEYRDVLAYDERGARIVSGVRMTPTLPALLGASPVLGRGFTADDAAAGAPAVVMLSYETWQRDYGGARDVLGRAITLDEVSHVVIGVMPAAWDVFASPVRPVVWFPLRLGPPSTSYADFQAVQVLAEMRPDVSLDAASVEVNALLERAIAEAPRPQMAPGMTARLARASERVGSSMRDALFVVLGAVGLVLLVACSNVANLLLARGTSRGRELALRAALGASTWRLVRALLAECLLLALVAGVVGIAVGWLTMRVLVQFRPGYLVWFPDLQLDPLLLAFTFGVSAVTALLFGAAPALQLTSRRFGDALRSGASGVVRGGAGARLRKGLVAAQMALSVILLVSAGLLVRSVIYLQNVDVGFDTENLFTAQLSLPRSRYEPLPSRDVVAEQLLERLGSHPTVAAITQATHAPPNTSMSSGGGLEIRGATLSESEARAAYLSNYVRPEYFRTLGIRVLQGRTFAPDEAQSSAAVIVNRAAAERFWPAGNVVGAELRWGRTWATVVGVVDNVASGELKQSVDEPYLYWPFESERTPISLGRPPGITLIVRANGDPAGAIAALRAETRAIDPEIAIENINTSEAAYAFTIAAPRFNMALLSAFAVIGLVLAAVGLAAVIGYEVAERTHEFGIRMALGARRESVRRLAMKHGLTPAFVGVVVGVIGALGAAQLATSLLHGVAPRDPLTFAGVVAVLVLVALGASWLPARRATRVDPITALRAE